MFAAGIFIPITIEAGYDNNMTLLFNGHINYCYSEREQVKDVVTKINAYDGGYDLINALSNRTIAKGQGTGQILHILEGDFPTVKHGEIGSISNNEIRTRGSAIIGNTFQYMNRYSDGKTVITNNKTYTLADNEVVEGDISLISSKTGLLGTPQRQDRLLVCDMIFEPRLVYQQIVNLQSEIMPLYNGQYKVTGLVHDIHISEVECGVAQTSLTLNLPQLVLNKQQSFVLVKNDKTYPQNYSTAIDGDVSNVWNYLYDNGKPPTTRVTDSILWSQMLVSFRSGNEHHPVNEMPTLQQLQNLKATAELLQNTVDTYFQGASIKVESGWRSVGGSRHESGQAVDFNLPGYSSSYIEGVLKSSWSSNGIARMGLAYSHVHIDTDDSKGRAIFSDPT